MFPVVKTIVPLLIRQVRNCLVPRVPSSVVVSCPAPIPRGVITASPTGDCTSGTTIGGRASDLFVGCHPFASAGKTPPASFLSGLTHWPKPFNVESFSQTVIFRWCHTPTRGIKTIWTFPVFGKNPTRRSNPFVSIPA